jgi:hypothetical protein
MKKCIEILDFEDKETQAGKKYVRFKTSEGWMSCFDANSFNELKKVIGKKANCEIIEKGEFKNIKKFLETVDEDSVETVKIGENSGKTEFPNSMKVAYAKDVFCAVCSRISQAEFDNMNEEERLKLADLAIKVIKKIESSF